MARAGFSYFLYLCLDLYVLFSLFVIFFMSVSCVDNLLDVSTMDYKSGRADSNVDPGFEKPTDSDMEKDPTITSEARTFQVVIQDTAVLPCEVENRGDIKIAWKKNGSVLFAGGVKVYPDKRFKMIDELNLEIEKVEPGDAATYYCQLGTMETTEIAHTLVVLVPPVFDNTSSPREMRVKRGSSVTLHCKASGNPVPNITWTRKNNLLPSGKKSEEGFSLTVNNANRHHAGTYICIASNGVGEPVQRLINLHVQFPPEIDVEEEWIHSGEGYEAQLVCIIHSDPVAQILWFRNTLRLDPTEHRIMEYRGSRHTLIIRKVQKSDFGNYTCQADNIMGRARKSLELSGKPKPGKFRSHPAGMSRESYNITFMVTSFTPVEEFKLFYRKMPPSSAPEDLNSPVHKNVYRGPVRRENITQGLFVNGRFPGDWGYFILPAIPSEQLEHQMSFNIKGLEPATKYEAKVIARNRFGWSEESEVFQFSTRGAGNVMAPFPDTADFSDPVVRDMGVTAAGTSAPLAIFPIFLTIALLVSMWNIRIVMTGTHSNIEG